VAVIGDRYGALTLGAAALYGQRGLRVHQDLRSGQLALANNAGALDLAGSFSQHPLGPELLAGAGLVLAQLPRSLDELDELADAVARHALPGTALLAAGRVKHMGTGMNRVLGQHFGSVTAGLARQKARVLTATLPLPGPAASGYPKREFHPDLGLWLCAHGAVFAGTSVDIGTRFLLDFLDRARPGAVTAVDLGCGSGLIAAALASARPQLRVIATDQSAAAVASAAATADANGVGERITAVHDDAMGTFPAGSQELVVLNPPFHLGSSVHAGAALKLFDAAARVLAPGGELWCVYNRHLDYAAQLERRVGRTSVVGRNAKFCVSVSVRRNSAGAGAGAAELSR
jgi:16S rRNA (guanine1207-N2)-methyltransferase